MFQLKRARVMRISMMRLLMRVNLIKKRHVRDAAIVHIDAFVVCSASAVASFDTYAVAFVRMLNAVHSPVTADRGISPSDCLRVYS